MLHVGLCYLYRICTQLCCEAASMVAFVFSRTSHHDNTRQALNKYQLCKMDERHFLLPSGPPKEVSQILVVGGVDSKPTSTARAEVVDLVSPGKVCQAVENYPLRISYAVNITVLSPNTSHQCKMGHVLGELCDIFEEIYANF